jgi:hypothetical protein
MPSATVSFGGEGITSLSQTSVIQNHIANVAGRYKGKLYGKFSSLFVGTRLMRRSYCSCKSLNDQVPLNRELIHGPTHYSGMFASKLNFLRTRQRWSLMD